MCSEMTAFISGWCGLFTVSTGCAWPVQSRGRPTPSSNKSHREEILQSHLKRLIYNHIGFIFSLMRIYPRLSYGFVSWGALEPSGLKKKWIWIIPKINFGESFPPVFKKSQLLNLSSLFVFEIIWFCTSECALTRGRDVHEAETTTVLEDTERWFMSGCFHRRLFIS